jgi:hypothetical protein
MKIFPAVLTIGFWLLSFGSNAAQDVHLKSYKMIDVNKNVVFSATNPPLTKYNFNNTNFPVNICSKKGNTFSKSFQSIEFKQGIATSIGGGKLTVDLYFFTVNNYNKDKCFEAGDVVQEHKTFRFPIKNGEFTYPVGNEGDMITLVGASD